MAENGGKLEMTGGSIDFSPSSRQSVDLSGHVHHLPCSVKFTGPSDISHYFKPKSTGFEVDGLAMEEAFFRGRKLQGVKVPMPEGYSGYVLGQKNPSKEKAASKSRTIEISSGSENSWETLAKCGNMTFWNHDSLPSQDDASLRMFHLFAVAKALHEPLKVEDLPSLTEDQSFRN